MSPLAGHDFEIMKASIKKWCVGSPVQAALDAAEALLAQVWWWI